MPRLNKRAIKSRRGIKKRKLKGPELEGVDLALGREGGANRGDSPVSAETDDLSKKALAARENPARSTIFSSLEAPSQKKDQIGSERE